MTRPFRFIVSGLALSGCLIAQPYRLVVIHGESMSPTYGSGQFVLSSRFDSSFHRGEAVVFNHEGETLVKRVAFLPGDKILEFKFLEHWIAPANDFLLARMEARGLPSRYVAIPPDRLYVLGDNAPESVDSRTFGPIPVSSVIGEVLDAPRPDRISGFAGAAELDGPTRETFRKQPLSPVELSKVKLSDRAGVD